MSTRFQTTPKLILWGNPNLELPAVFDELFCNPFVWSIVVDFTFILRILYILYILLMSRRVSVKETRLFRAAESQCPSFRC